MPPATYMYNKYHVKAETTIYHMAETVGTKQGKSPKTSSTFFCDFGLKDILQVPFIISIINGSNKT